MRGLLLQLLSGKFFSYLILSLYALRCGSYLFTKHWGPATYWICAFGITLSAEFFIKRWP